MGLAVELGLGVGSGLGLGLGLGLGSELGLGLGLDLGLRLGLEVVHLLHQSGPQLGLLGSGFSQSPSHCDVHLRLGGAAAAAASALAAAAAAAKRPPGVTPLGAGTTGVSREMGVSGTAAGLAVKPG